MPIHTCPDCDRENREAANFCKFCGVKFDPEQARLQRVASRRVDELERSAKQLSNYKPELRHELDKIWEDLRSLSGQAHDRHSPLPPRGVLGSISDSFAAAMDDTYRWLRRVLTAGFILLLIHVCVGVVGCIHHDIVDTKPVPGSSAHQVGQFLNWLDRSF